VFVTDRLVYLQLHKTACTHIANLLQEVVDGEQVGKHNRLERIPDGKYIAGSIRNPWDWYVSLWAFGCRGKGSIYHALTSRRWRPGERLREAAVEVIRRRRAPVAAAARLRAELDKPRDLWRATYNDSDDPHGFRTWIRLLLDPRRSDDLAEGYGRSSISRFAGLMTYRYQWFAARDPRAVDAAGTFADLDELRRFDAEQNVWNGAIRTESLEDDLLRVLEEAGYVLTEEQVRRIRDGAGTKTNTSRHRPSAFYYDAETARLVAERDRLIVEKYAYTPPNVATDGDAA
jgi:hypothetical protein